MLNDLRAGVFQAIHSKTNDIKSFQALLDFQQNLISFSILPSPYENCTEEFLNDFSVKTINFILDTETKNNLLTDNFSTILKNYLFIFLKLFDQPYYAFLTSVSHILDENKPFYKATSHFNYFLVTSQSKYFTNNLKILDESSIFDKMVSYYEQLQSISYEHTSILLNFLCFVKKTILSKKLTNHFEFICNNILERIENIDENKFRDIDEKHMNCILNSIIFLDPKKYEDWVTNFSIKLNIRYVNSSFLNKRFYGLSQLRGILIKNKNKKQDICQVLIDNKVLDTVLKDFHNQLVYDFVLILSEMIKFDFEVTNYLTNFWTTTLNQHTSVMNDFFKGWDILVPCLDEKYINLLFLAISDTYDFPESSLVFLQKISHKANNYQKENIYSALVTFYSTNPNFSEKYLTLLINTINLYISTNEQFRINLIKDAIEMIENDYNAQLALNLLLISSDQIKAEQSLQLRNFVIRKMNISNSLHYLPLLEKLLKINQTPLDIEQFHQILNSLSSKYLTDSQIISEFFITTIGSPSNSETTYSIDMKKELFIGLCDVESTNSYLVRLIICIFENIKTATSEKFGLDNLWNLVFRTNSLDIIKILSKCMNINDFLNKCMNNIKNDASLSAIDYLIHEIEDEYNKEQLGLSCNRYLDPEDMISINVVSGEFSTIMRVPFWLKIKSVRMRISSMINVLPEYLKIQVNGSPVSNWNSTLQNNTKITVKVINNNISSSTINHTHHNVHWNPYTIPNLNANNDISKTINDISFQKINIKAFPTQILSKLEYSALLFDLLNDKKYGIKALNILNELPTIESSLIDFEQIKDWDIYFPIDKPNLLIYHLNTIGNYLDIGNHNWNIHFLESGCALKIFLIFLNDEVNFVEQKERILLLRIVMKTLLIDLPENDNHLSDFLQKIDSIYISHVINKTKLLLTNDTHINLIYRYLYILNIILQKRDALSCDIPNLMSILDYSLFHKMIKFNRIASDMFQNIKMLRYPLSLIQLFPRALMNSSFLYLDIFESISQEFEDKVSIWNCLLNSFLSYFKPLKENDFTHKIEFTFPQNVFLNRLFCIFSDLANKLTDIPSIEQMINFLINDLVFNFAFYFEISQDFLDLVTLLLNKKPELKISVFEKLKNVFNDILSIEKTNISIEMNQGVREKGIINLGATCYIGSLLQQLYSIPTFRSTILNYDYNEENDQEFKWLNELQYLFLKLLFFPSSSIDPSDFIKSWKGWDGSPIDPRQQQDAVEFLQMIFERIDSVLPECTQIFKGIIQHHTEGIGNDYVCDTDEEYINISLDVKDHEDISQSFTTFCTRDKFEGNNQINTEEFGLIDATQSHKIKKPSPILIFTLKRFEFNMSTNIREKICTKYKFPSSIDISSILIDDHHNKNDQQLYSTQYDLCGVVVHQGNANSGHYISHIKNYNNQWKIFNDSLVTNETEKNMFNETYGGNSMQNVSIDYDNTTEFDYGSAYLLFYKVKDYDFDVKKTINNKILLRLAEEIKSKILCNLSKSKGLFQFLIKVCNDPFFLISLVENNFFSPDCSAIIFSSLVDFCSKNCEFANQFLKYFSENYMSIICNANEQICCSYTSMVIAAMDILTKDEIQKFTNQLFIKIDEGVKTNSNQEQSEDYTELNDIDNNTEKIGMKSNSGINSGKDNTLNNNGRNRLLKYIVTILGYYIEKYGTEGTNDWIPYLVCFLSNHNNVDSEPIFNLIMKLVQTDKSSYQIFEQFLSDDIVYSYFVTDMSTGYIKIMISMLCNDPCKAMNLISFILSNNIENSFILAKLFICILSLEEHLCNNCIIVMNNVLPSFQSPNHLVHILSDTQKLVAQFYNETYISFYSNCKIFIINWILHINEDLREKSYDLFETYINQIEKNPEINPKESLFTVLKTLIGDFTYIQNKINLVMHQFMPHEIDSQIVESNLPIKHYFKLLNLIVTKGQFNDEVLLYGEKLGKFSKSISNSLDKVTYYLPRRSILMFVCNVISESKASEFFQNETVSLFVESLEDLAQPKKRRELEDTGYIILRFFSLVPRNQTMKIMKSSLLVELFKSQKIMADEKSKILVNIINDNIENGISNYQTICTNYFTIAVNYHLNSKRFIPMQLCINLLKNNYVNTHLTNVIYKNNFDGQIWDFVYKFLNDFDIYKIPIDPMIYPFTKILGLYIYNFATNDNNKKSSIFFSSKNNDLTLRWVNRQIPLKLILQIAFQHEVVACANSGLFKFLHSLFYLENNKFIQELLNIAQPYIIKGFIHSVKNNKSKLDAARFLQKCISVALPSKNPQNEMLAANIYAKELSLFLDLEISDKDALYIISNEVNKRFSSINDGECLRHLENKFQHVFSETNDFSLFESKQMKELAIKIGERIVKKNSNIFLLWIVNINRLIQTLIKNQYNQNNAKKIVNGFIFLDMLKKSCGTAETPKLKIEESDIMSWANEAQNGTSKFDDIVSMRLVELLSMV
ncbi:hypothetical protein TRFO_30630 [Tritrichomonas foetus]|uniref:USP domain-containing protein n=1 Tax=Tritrichomonas foetus TaxID=1144522 RepID=A0A1J4JT70_9EUKA|nr:hypothetical protein TRFO_30630 [Tritrichomonas foetus]|eukprot:OHT02267.1 hypothetical protein TRFO_30630 [Tritrichomonas foetus]